MGECKVGGDHDWTRDENFKRPFAASGHINGDATE